MRRFLAVLSGVLIALGLALAISLVLDDEPASEDGAARTDVEVTLDPGDGPSRSAALRCDGEAETDAEACRVLDELDEDVLDPVPPGRSCTSQFGGPETVTVRGTLRGEPVDARFDRTDGCESARYSQIEPLLLALDL